MKPNHVDLGLAISGLHCRPGVPKSAAEIAAYCVWDPTKNKWRTISRQRIQQIEERALRKLRRNPDIKEWVDHLHHKKP